MALREVRIDKYRTKYVDDETGEIRGFSQQLPHPHHIHDGQEYEFEYLRKSNRGRTVWMCPGCHKEILGN